MSDQYRVAFVGFDADTDSQNAIERLAAKLGVSKQKVESFTQGKPLFGSTDKSKCLKQVKLLAIYGFQSKVLEVQTSVSQPNNAANERVFEALDYITSSLIRIEEKLEELEQRIDGQQKNDDDKEQDQWQSDDLFDELDLDTETKPKSKKLLYTLLSILIVLLIVLGFSLAFPEMVQF
ncbi:hypothetical protein N474_03885 [Pseudoalteromonas luteoviolacea CPMOR-2]|uniref:Uncharacterized protein n=1 Tax=Pseudoalteromonas luteoviolacea DSM 6061 TaxID=1365250 RepID=A0A167BR56_9GAMM|nr:hypothetical protein [Pseudoalteromonas luteoviolacea]KZN46812.1 hypothetical protein N475_07330 [Pseudoalteromonas luteoviolacea DSM 6061]KZN50522.1 hypothetical protein N474_03885 [Pseudoalteromonas luteoviolacea CPMOR-2]MBE0385020.1 hypothetical protein [Pseudoalteromonas luteoviolacea DSM 6061]